jgi:hypothetical protein
MTSRDITECGMCITIDTRLLHFLLISGLGQWLLHAELISRMAILPIIER